MWDKFLLALPGLLGTATSIPASMLGWQGILARWGLILVVLAGFTGYIWFKGDEYGTEKLTNYLVKEQTQVIKIQKQVNSVTTQFITDYVDRVVTVKERGDEIIREVPVYVRSDCILPNGFVRLYNAAISGTVAGAAQESDGAASGITIPDLATIDFENIKSCRFYRERALGWQEWYEKIATANH